MQRYYSCKSYPHDWEDIIRYDREFCIFCSGRYYFYTLNLHTKYVSQITCFNCRYCFSQWTEEDSYLISYITHPSPYTDNNDAAQISCHLIGHKFPTIDIENNYGMHRTYYAKQLNNSSLARVLNELILQWKLHKDGERIN